MPLPYVGRLELPFSTGVNVQDATTYKGNIDADMAVFARTAGMFAPHANTVPDMRVYVGPGSVFDGTTLTEVGAFTTANINGFGTGTITGSTDGISGTMLVTGKNIPDGTTATISGTTVTFSNAPTATTNGVVLKFSQRTAVITAPVSNPRIDRIVVDSATGAVSVIAGTEAVTPTPPAITSGKLPVAQVLLQTSTTAITDDMITDERNFGGSSSSSSLALNGECKLSLNGSNLQLDRYNGQYINIDGAKYSIPSAGVTLAPTSLAASTLYYIYAYMSGATMTLEASTTAYATDSTTGVNIKSGDSTRTLVGMARTDGSTAWADSATKRFVRSWFNDPGVYGVNNFTAGRSTAATSPTEINSEIRIEFLLWSGEKLSATISGFTNKNTTSGSVTTYAYLDGSTQLVATTGQSTIANSNFPLGASTTSGGISEGYHYATVFGQNNTAGTASYSAQTQLSINTGGL